MLTLALFMKTFPAAVVSQSQQEPVWGFCRLHGHLTPGMADWLAAYGLKAEYRAGGYDLRWERAPLTEINSVARVYSDAATLVAATPVRARHDSDIKASMNSLAYVSKRLEALYPDLWKQAITSKGNPE